MEFDKIYLVWRKGAGDRRTAVGELVRISKDEFSFKYLPEAIELQKQGGFTPYTEFQDLNKEYTENVVDIFAQRLTKNARPDINSFYRFWEVDLDKKQDKFYLLGKTQGLVSTDNFEFLADYHYTPNLHFLTEIAGLSSLKLHRGVLAIGDVLAYELEPNNPKDEWAVKLFKDGFHVGYIKKYHSKVFHKAEGRKLKIKVIAIDQNGILKRAFIKIAK